MKRLVHFLFIFACGQSMLFGMLQKLNDDQLVIARERQPYNARLPRKVSLHCSCGEYLGDRSLFNLMTSQFSFEVTEFCIKSNQFDCNESILQVIADVPTIYGNKKNGYFITPFQELVLCAADYNTCPEVAVQKAELLKSYGARLKIARYYVLSGVVKRPMSDFIETVIALIDRNDSDAAQTQAVLQKLLDFVVKPERS